MNDQNAKFIDFHIAPEHQQKYMYGIARVKLWNKIVVCYKVVKKDDGSVFVAETSTKFGDDWKPNHIVMDTDFNKEVRSMVFNTVRSIMKNEEREEAPF